jgi:hypothetical protein
MSGAAGSFAHVSLHVGARFMVRCSTYPDQVPILTIDAGDTTWSITPTGRDATDEALQFARELVRKALQFAAEIERVHAARHPSDTKADASKAA